jgi:MFS family permease
VSSLSTEGAAALDHASTRGSNDATTPGSTPARRRDFAGWHMVWALSATVTVAYGVLFYAFAVFVVPMREELGASTGQLSGALSLAIAVHGAAAVAVGRHLDRHGARWLMTTGSLVGALSVVLWSQAQTLPQLYLAFVGVGLAGAALMYDPAFALVTTWFDRDRNAALLTLTVVAGFAATVFLPLSQWLVDGLGWRSALLVLAGLVAAGAVPHAVLLRRAPADIGLGVDGGPPAPAATADQVAPDRAVLRAAWRRRAVRLLTAAAVLETLAVTVVAVHLVAYLRDTGASASTAAWSAGAIGILSVAGRIAVTALAGRVGLARLSALMVGGQAVGVAALLTMPRPAGLVVFVVLFGAGFGVMTIARAALLGRYVPVRVFGSVSGRQALATGLGRVAAPGAAGALITTLGYTPALLAVAACSLGASALLVSAEAAHP